MVKILRNERQDEAFFEREVMRAELIYKYGKKQYDLTHNGCKTVEELEADVKSQLKTTIKRIRDVKVSNHKTRVPSWILKLNGKTVLDVNKDLKELWNYTDKQIDTVVDDIVFEERKDGPIYVWYMGERHHAVIVNNVLYVEMVYLGRRLLKPIEMTKGTVEDAEKFIENRTGETVNSIEYDYYVEDGVKTLLLVSKDTNKVIERIENDMR